MSMRLGICGSAGTMKSTLAEGVANALGIPNLKSREITEDILRRDGYNYGSGIQIERFLANTGRQNEILRRTIEQQSVPDFVTDRTVIDLTAYAVCEMHHSDALALRRIVDTCRKNVSVYTHIFFCPWVDTSVSATGKRTLNPWYQYLVHLIERGILDEWGCKYHILVAEGRDNRLEEIKSLLKADTPEKV